MTKYACIRSIGVALIGVVGAATACNSNSTIIPTEVAADAGKRVDAGKDSGGNSFEFDAGNETTFDATTSGDDASEDSGEETGPNTPIDSSVVDSATAIDAGVDAGGGIPTSCAEANDVVGCCEGNVAYFCSANTPTTLQQSTCTGTKVCGWNASKGYYSCITNGDGGADPSGTNPIACNGSGGNPVDSGAPVDAGIDSGSHVDAGIDAGVDAAGSVTWTELYAQIFGPSGTSTCSGSSCHTNTQSGFKCGTSATTCYNGMVSAGLVTPGASASSSNLVDSSRSPLCGTLGGSMPKNGTCVTDEQVDLIQSWLAAGAQDD